MGSQRKCGMCGVWGAGKTNKETTIEWNQQDGWRPGLVKSQGLELEWVCVELGDPERLRLDKEPSWLCKGGLWTMLVSPHATVLFNSMMIQEWETLLVHVPIMCEESTGKKHRAKKALAYWTDYFLTRSAGCYLHSLYSIVLGWGSLNTPRVLVSTAAKGCSWLAFVLLSGCWVLDLLSSSVSLLL